MLRITQIVSPISRTPMLRQPMLLGRLPASCLDHLYGYDHEAEFELVMACRDGVNTASEALGRGAEIYGSRSHARWAYDERPAQQELTWQEIERNKQLEREARAEREWKAWEVKKVHYAIIDRWRDRSLTEAKAGRQFASDFAAAHEEEERRVRAEVEAAAKARHEAALAERDAKLAAERQRRADAHAAWREAKVGADRAAQEAREAEFWKQQADAEHARQAERRQRQAAELAAQEEANRQRDYKNRLVSDRYLEKTNELINNTLPQILSRTRVGHWSADHSFFLNWRQVMQLPPCFKCGGVFPAVDYNLLNDGALGIRHQCQHCRLAIRYIVPHHARQPQPEMTP